MMFLRNILALGAAMLCLYACQKNAPAGSGQQADAPAKDPLFKLLPADQTGIDFSNDIVESDALNIFTYGHLYNGGGVGVLDVDKDGLMDLYFTSTTGSCRLYRNKGQFQFEDITEKAGVAAAEGIKTGVCCADVNNDGWMDIFVCRSGPTAAPIRHNLLFINNKNNTFTESSLAYGLDDMAAHSMVTFFDFDKDGDLDLYMVNTQVDFSKANSMNVVRGADGRVARSATPLQPVHAHRLYRNDEGKFFRDVSEQAGVYSSAYGLSANVFDVNDDDYPDLYVGNDFIEPDFFYLNQHNGKFSDRSAEMLRHMSIQTMGADVADINNDGLMDIFTLDMLPENYPLQQQRVTAMKEERYHTLLGNGYGHQLMRNVLQLNNGFRPGSNLPSFSDIGCLAGVFQTDWSWTPLLQDFDNDGWRDIFITNGYYRDVTNADVVEFTIDSIAHVTGGFKNYKLSAMKPLLEVIPQFKLSNYAYRNRGVESSGICFDDKSHDWGLAEKSFSNGAVYADLDNDGDLDLVVNNIAQSAFIYQNTSADRQQNHWLQLELEGSPNNPFGVGAKIRAWAGEQIFAQESYPVRGFFSSVSPIVHFGLGANTSLNRLEVLFPEGRVVTLSNVPANQRLHIRYTDAKPGKLTPLQQPAAPIRELVNTLGLDFTHTENVFHDFNQERLLPWKQSQPGPCMASGDVNGDGLVDFYIGGANDQAGGLFVQAKSGAFVRDANAVWEADKSFEDSGAVFFDADQDQDLDLLVASGGYAYPANSAQYQPRLYQNDGKGHFSRTTGVLPELTDCAGVVSAKDLDGDGDQDILIGGYAVPGAYPTTPKSTILQNESGRFRDATASICPEFEHLGMLRAMLWANLDGDKQEELIVTGEWMPIVVFKKSGKQLQNVSAQLGFNQKTGFWRSLVCDDFDKDGDLDLVCGNLGQNTRFRASEDAPLTLYALDFDKNGSIDPLMFWQQNGVERPVAYRDVLLKQIPVLKKKYVRTAPYAQATVKDLVPEPYYSNAQKLRSSELSTLYFENVNGRFNSRSLPVEAQIAPAQAMVSHDVNRDGFPDLIIVGNDFGQQVETGRIDAGNGAVLLGNGKGQFKALKPRESGLWANLDARSLCLIPNKGVRKTLLLVGNSNGRMQTFAF